MNEAKRLKELEAENNKLKKMLADKMLEVEAMKDVLSKVVTPATRKPVAQHLIDAFHLSERVACKLAGLSRTAFRYKPKTNSDSSLRQRLKSLATQYPRYGYLMLHGLLRAKAGLRIVNAHIGFTPRKAYRLGRRNVKLTRHDSRLKCQPRLTSVGQWTLCQTSLAMADVFGC